jgi:hypothetical protein
MVYIIVSNWRRVGELSIHGDITQNLYIYMQLGVYMYIYMQINKYLCFRSLA